MLGDGVDDVVEDLATLGIRRTRLVQIVDCAAMRGGRSTR
jgi:hypothetical protein